MCVVGRNSIALYFFYDWGNEVFCKAVAFEHFHQLVNILTCRQKTKENMFWYSVQNGTGVQEVISGVTTMVPFCRCEVTSTFEVFEWVAMTWLNECLPVRCNYDPYMYIHIIYNIYIYMLWPQLMSTRIAIRNTSLKYHMIYVIIWLYDIGNISTFPRIIPIVG